MTSRHKIAFIPFPSFPRYFVCISALLLRAPIAAAAVDLFFAASTEIHKWIVLTCPSSTIHLVSASNSMASPLFVARSPFLCPPSADSSSMPRQHFLLFPPRRHHLNSSPCFRRTLSNPCVCAAQGGSRKPTSRGRRHVQNVDLPPILPKNKKKPYPIPLKKIQRAARADKKLAQLGIEKLLEPPKNGLLVPHLIPVAHEVLEEWKILIKGLSRLLHVVQVYGCSHCPEVHVGPTGHRIPDCRGSGNVHRRSLHSWVRGSVDDVLTPIESYHMFDPFGVRIKHETRLKYDRIPAIVELCIQAGVEIPEYPSRRRIKPIRMLGKKVIDRGEYVEEPKSCISGDSMPYLAEFDTYVARNSQPPSSVLDSQKIAERTIKAYGNVKQGLEKLMKKYTVKACGYCSEVHVGPWGHNAKLCGEFKHQWRDGKHGWQDAVPDEVLPPNYVWHVRDPEGPPLAGALKRFYGKAPAVVEVCVQAGAAIPDAYRPMMRLDIVIPDSEEARLVA